MADLLKSLSGKSAFLIAWTLAAAIGFGAWALLLLPLQQRLRAAGVIAGWDQTTKDLVLAGSVIVTGFLLAQFSTPLYRLLEGYLWPKRLRDWGRARQKTIKAALHATATSDDIEGSERALAYERLSRYPADDGELAPTRLGNAIRAFETYGVDRYQLDSQTFWTELSALSPEWLQNELDTSRAATDFFVALYYIAAAWGLLALVLFSLEWRWTTQIDYGVGLAGLAAVAILPTVCYRLAITTTSYWATTVQAMVNLGRVPLAKSYGLSLPDSLSAERDMWNALTNFVYFPYADGDQGASLEPFRIKTDTPDQPNKA